ncbi:hypothetical protein [Pseudogemmobacter faecipullorum]|uniref:Uncharacterized protein n=1 Tax=Pseudogemmobacter faecipullorum TaxID=2755041 RepID=A0ABS8CS82_9RHOB|nr:hypothetical protein [Pseudogemmobacter faecipullorum]MCB5412271.1 hypothetical protein [Pseudogemmobacter faecipullorum]
MPSRQLDDDDIRFLSHHLRGVRQARLRFLNATPTYELALVEALLAMGVSVTTEKLGAVAPYPRRRFGIRYKDGQAILTVAPDAALMG